MRNVDLTIKKYRPHQNLRVSSKTDVRGEFDDPRWHLAQRIAVSRSIGRSPLLSEFLLYVCDRKIREKTSELTEQRIGVQVFGRIEGYNSNDDNIVRNYARTLRKRVDEYFATEGKHEELKLEIPRGAYIPVFYSRSPEKPLQHEAHQALAAPSAPVHENLPSYENSAPSLFEASREKPLPSVEGRTPHNDSRLLSALYLPFALGFLLIAAVAAYLAVHGFPYRWRNAATAASQPISSSDVLWGQLFQKDRDTFIVPADSGLVILQGLTRRPVSLGDYVSGNYRAEATSVTGLSAANVKELGTRRYTSIVDLNLVSHLSRLKQIIPERILIRYARDLRMDDLRSSNAILLGSVDSNPWVELFEQQLNFRFSFSPKSDTAPIIINQNPLAGEQSVYANRHMGSWHNTFGRIAYLPNLDGTGHVLLVGGLNMAGTQAAGDFVLNPALMQPTLDHARAPNGSIRPFEILIETDNVAANASRPHVASERIAPR
jgi:hypothetical protein